MRLRGWKSIVAFLLFTGAQTLATNGPTEKLQKLSSGYEHALDQIDDNFRNQEKLLLTNYTKALERLDAKLKAKGDLEGILVIREELKLAKTGKTEAIPPADEANLPELTEIRKHLEKFLTSLRKEEQEKKIRIAEKYIAMLEPLKKHLVQQNQVDEALVAKQEIERAGAIVAMKPKETPTPKSPRVSSKKSQPQKSKAKVSPAEDFQYKIENNGITIEKYIGHDRDVVIPNTLDGKPVHKIATKAFEKNERLRSIKLPDSIKNIGMMVFIGCSNLKYIDLGLSVETIDWGCFFSTPRLEKVVIPDSTKHILAIFIGSPHEVEFSPNSPFALRDHIIYSKDGTVLVAHTGFPFSYFRVPDNVISIKDCAFQLAHIEKIFIPNTLQKIEAKAFGPSNLQEIYFDGDAPSIGNNVFKDIPLRTIHYREGAQGWPEEIQGIPTKALKKPPSWVKKKSKLLK
jgi:hypothetical protein